MTASESDGQGTDQGNDLWFLFFVLVLAFLFRLGFAMIFAPLPWPDSFVYLASGTELVRSGQIASDNVMPLYPAVLALTGWEQILQWQAALSASLVLIAYRLALAVFASRSAARCAAVLMALEPVTIFYANQRLTETLFTFLLSLALLVFFSRRYFSGSVLLVASVLVRPTLDYVAPLLVLAFSLTNDGRFFPRRVVARLATYGLVYVALMSPWWWHNYQKYGRFVRLHLGDGVVLRVENNAAFAEAGFDWNRLVPIFHEFDHVEDPVRRNALHREAARRYIAEDPARYLAASLRRLGRFWSPVMDQSEPWAVPRWLRFVGSLAATALFVGAALCLARDATRLWSRMLPLLLVMAYLTAVHAAMHALVRYRFPLTPMLVVLSAGFWHRMNPAALLRRRG